MILSLSSSQREIWLDQALHPGLPLYHLGGCLGLDGPLDPTLFAQAVAAVVQAHDALRTGLVPGEDLPRQRFVAGVSPVLERLDFSASEDAEERARAWMEAEMVAPMDLFRGPLFRFALLRVGRDRHCWFQKYHHLIVDGWAIALVIRRVAAAYQALRSGEPAVPTPPPSYAAAVAADEAYRCSAAHGVDEAFWRGRYQGLGLPEPVWDLERRARPGHRVAGECATRWINPEQFSRLRDFAAGEGVTPFHVFQGLLYAYLARIGQRDEVALGLPVLNRPDAAARETVGLFTNTVPAWYRLGTDLGFRDLVRALREEGRLAAPHRRFPLGAIRRLVAPAAGAQARLFDATLSYLGGDCDVRFGEAQARFRFLHGGQEQSGLTVYVENFHARGAVAMQLDASPAAFSPGDVTRLGDRLEFLLDGVMRRPDQPLRALEILPDAERQVVLGASPPAVFPVEGGLADLFERQAERSPGRSAVSWGGMDPGTAGSRLSYAELDGLANRTANALRALGVAPGSIVGVWMERSVEAVVAILGVLKAGASYLPIDPAYPAERVEFMLSDSAAGALVASPSLLDRGVVVGRPVLSLDAALAALAGFGPERPARSGSPGEVAYVIYTSGSTGRPKGVRVTHANVVRLFGATDDWFHFGADDVWTLFHSLAFDFSVWEMWGALLHGGRLVVVPFEVSRSPAAFRALLAAEQVTVLSQTPSAFRPLIQADAEAAPGPGLALRWVIFGGEALEPESLRPWLDRHGDERPRLINMYGITETTVHVTYRPVVRADLERGGSPIGRPIPDLRVWLLDRHGQPVPIGVTGEIHVGGAGVASGYLNRPELTAARFLPSPFGRGTMYRSGDLARWTPDGELEYLGRGDQQVKIRGFRVELGEIEARLMELPEVREAVVVCRDEPPGGAQLVAYLVVAEGFQGSTSGGGASWRRRLEQRLPDYMIPSSWVCLEALPLTTNGKVDRRALPAPAASDRAVAAVFEPPASPTEQAIAHVWQELLGLDRVGRQDGFVFLGGNSLLAAQATGRLSRALGQALPLRWHLEADTLARLAGWVDASRPFAAPAPSSGLAQPIPRLRRRGGGDR